MQSSHNVRKSVEAVQAKRKQWRLGDCVTLDNPRKVRVYIYFFVYLCYSYRTYHTENITVVHVLIKLDFEIMSPNSYLKRTTRCDFISTSTRLKSSI